MRRSERGSVAIQLGLMIIILGMVGLGVAITFVLYKQRQKQSATDSAAFGGATALMRGYPTHFTVESRAIAAAVGFVNGVDGVAVTVNRPPTLGSHAGDNNAVGVIVSQPQYLGLVALFREGLFQVGARAVALIGNSSLYCLLALDRTAAQAVYLQNNVIVGNPECGAAVNSNSDSAIYVRNNAEIKGPVSVHGNWPLSNNAKLAGDPVANHAPRITDPYGGVALQTLPPCTGQTSKQAGGTANLTEGRFCDGRNYTNNVTINMAPGTCFIDKTLTVGNNATLNGNQPVNGKIGVTLIINGDYPIDFSNNAQITLTVPKPGDGIYPGMAFNGPPRREIIQGATLRQQHRAEGQGRHLYPQPDPRIPQQHDDPVGRLHSVDRAHCALLQQRRSRQELRGHRRQADRQHGRSTCRIAQGAMNDRLAA